MSPRAPARLAWVLFAAVVALALGTVASIAFAGASLDDAFGLLVIGYAIVGTLIASRHPANPIGWILLAIALSFALSFFGEAYAASESNPGLELVVWLSAWGWWVWLMLAAIFLPLLFPDGRLLSRRWRPVAWLGAAALGSSILSEALRPGDLDLDSAVAIANPLGVGGAAADVVALLEDLGNVLAAVAFLLAAASLVIRFRRSDGVERLQLKWFAYVGLIALAGLAVAMVQVLGGTQPGEESGSSLVDVLGVVGWGTALLSIVIGIPVATGVAILRHRLYDVDVVIKRTLVYGALTATLLAAYLGSVLLLQLALSPLTEESDLAIAGSTLAVAALFRPARRRIQAAVDRRFFRRRYDAARTLERFGARLRDEVDLDSLNGELRAVVADTMQPAHVSLWLRAPGAHR